MIWVKAVALATLVMAVVVGLVTLLAMFPVYTAAGVVAGLAFAALVTSAHDYLVGR